MMALTTLRRRGRSFLSSKNSISVMVRFGGNSIRNLAISRLKRDALSTNESDVKKKAASNSSSGKRPKSNAKQKKRKIRC